MGDNIPFQLKSSISRIIRCTLIRPALLIHALFNMGGAQTGNSLYFTKKIIQNIPPMTEHIYDSPTIILFSIVPRGPLGRNGIPFKDPVTKFTSDGENFSKEAFFHQPFYFP